MKGWAGGRRDGHESGGCCSRSRLGEIKGPELDYVQRHGSYES